MVKNIIKEIIIVLLLALAIILILGVLLYRYTSYNKVLPEQVSYAIPENIKQELATSSNPEAEQPILTYEVTASDLKTYQRTKEYVQGRRDPFASVGDETTSQNATSGNTSQGSQTTGSTSSSNTSNTTNNNTSSQEDEKFFPDKGTK